MVRLFKYISVLLVVLLAFTLNVRAAGDQDSSKVKKTALDSIVIQVNGISTDDTLVFDDFDEDEPAKTDEKSPSITRNDSLISATSSCTVIMLAKLPQKKNAQSSMSTTFSCSGQRVDATMFYIDGTPVFNAKAFDSIATPLVLERSIITRGTIIEDVAVIGNPVAPKRFEMAVFPNPVTSASQPVTIDHTGYGSASIYVRTIGGQLVQKLFTTQKSVQIDGLASGTYLIQIVDEQNHTAAKRLIVE